MKTPLILSLLILISCTNKKQALIPNKKPFEVSEQSLEETPSEVVEAVEEFEYKSFLTIPHIEKKSSLRNQLINVFTESSLQKKALVIKERIELDATPMSTNELNRYKENENAFAKVIVSMTNGSEVFFVPENISLKNIVSKIGLTAEPDRKLKWLGVNELQLTEKSKSYYLLSVNHDDVIINDLDFYTNEINLSNRFAGQAVIFPTGTRLEINVSYKFLKERVADKLYVPSDVCSYKQVEATGEYAEIENQETSQLGFLFSKNKNWETVTNANAHRISNNAFRIHVLPKIELDKEFSIEFSQNVTALITESFLKQRIKFQCGWGFTLGYTVELKTKTEFNIFIKVFGRGEKLREITI